MDHQPIPGSGSGLKFLNYQFGDTTYTKVFVGGLAWETRSDVLGRYFEQFGEILEAVVITDKHTGRSKGYGFVTFRDPEAAKRSCTDPNPVIDGRRANCNLASLGRPLPFLTYGSPRSVMPYSGSPQAHRLQYAESPSYHQPVCYSYQPGFPYLQYGYPSYGPEYVHTQGVYNAYAGQHYLQIYGLPSTINPNLLSYSPMKCPSPGNLGSTTIPGFPRSGPPIMQYGRPNVTGATAETIPTIHLPYHAGFSAPSPGQAQIMVPALPPQFSQGSGNYQVKG